MIKIERVSVTYPGGVEALKDVDLEIQDGEFVVIVGLSGAGKSTLLRVLNGLVPATSGSIIVDGTEVVNANSQTLRQVRSKTGMIFQEFNLSLTKEGDNYIINGQGNFIKPPLEGEVTASVITDSSFVPDFSTVNNPELVEPGILKPNEAPPRKVTSYPAPLYYETLDPVLLISSERASTRPAPEGCYDENKLTKARTVHCLVNEWAEEGVHIAPQSPILRTNGYEWLPMELDHLLSESEFIVSNFFRKNSYFFKFIRNFKKKKNY